jgi:hypothetical protein
MSRNFTSDVDTQREYFNASYFNKSGTTQIAKYETTLLKPFFQDPDQWKLAINRFRLPLSAIPLTKNNIPHRQWQIGIQYSPLDGTPTSDVEYVKQYNSSTATFQTLNVASTATFSNYNSDFSEEYSTVNIADTNIISTVNYPAYDNINGGTLYFLGRQEQGTIIVNPNTGQTIQIIPNPPNIYSYTVCSNPTNGDLFISYTGVPNTPNSIRRYQRTNNTWTEVFTYAMPPGITDLIYTMIFFSNRIYFIGAKAYTYTIYYFDTGSTLLNTALVLDADNYQPFMNSNGQYIYTYGTNQNGFGNFTSYTVSGNNLVVNANVTMPYGFNNNYGSFPSFGFDNAGNTLINFNTGNKQAYNSQGVFQYNFTSPPTAVLIYPGTPIVDEIDVGSYDIYTYQQFLNKINDAFQLSFTNLKTTLGATFLPTQAPSVVFNPTTKLFSLVCEGLYTTLNSDGTNQYKILMNNTLWNKFLFPSTEVSPLVGFYSINIANYGINAVPGNGSITLPQFIYINQESSTIYAFNDLTRIIVATQGSIPVSGDGEGVVFTNTGSTTNNSINIITDIIPDTTVQMNSSPVIYVPNGILRWYNLYAQQPFSKIDLIFYYETKNGVINQVEIIDGEYFSVKLEFKKGAGDF